MRNWKRSWLLAVSASLVIASLATLLGSADVRAQSRRRRDSTDQPERRARELFRQGRIAMDAGEYDVALERFRSAHELAPRPDLLYSIGLAADRLGRDEEALRAYEGFIAERPESTNRPIVENRIAALRRRLEATRIESLQVAPQDPLGAPEQGSNLAPVSMSVARARGFDATVPVSLFVVAGLAAVGGVFTGLESSNLRTSLDASCPGRVCDSSFQTRANNMELFAVQTDILVATAGVALTIGVISLIVEASRDSSPRRVSCVGTTCGIQF